jgi:hypothetical protein
VSAFSDPPQAPEKSRRKWGGLVVLAAFIFLPLLAALLWFLNFRTSNSSAVEQLEARIKQRGEPLTLADLAATYPPFPDEENGAMALLRIWEEDDPPFWRAFREGKSSLPQKASRQYDAALPYLGSDTKHIARLAALTPTNIAAAETYLKEEKEHLNEIRTALRYPRFRFPIQFTNGIAMMLLPHLTELRQEAQGFRIEGLLASEQGDVDSAITAFEETARVGNVLTSDPLLMSQLVRLVCYRMVLDDTERLISWQSLSRDQLEKLDSFLDRLQMPGALRAALIAERVSSLGAFDLTPEALTAWESSESPRPGGLKAYRIGMGILKATGLQDADRHLMLQTMGKAISLAGSDDPKALKEYEELFRNVSAEAHRFPPKIFSAMLLLGLEKAATRFAQFEARRRAAKLALAVEGYRIAHSGDLPERLDELIPQFIAEIPKDPFDGQPLRFRRLATGFVVYSIGANRVDDGGREKPQKGSIEDYDETFIIER